MRAEGGLLPLIHGSVTALQSALEAKLWGPPFGLFTNGLVAAPPLAYSLPLVGQG